MNEMKTAGAASELGFAPAVFIQSKNKKWNNGPCFWHIHKLDGVSF